MKLEELIKKLSAFENQSNVSVKDIFGWRNECFDIENVVMTKDGTVMIEAIIDDVNHRTSKTLNCYLHIDDDEDEDSILLKIQEQYGLFLEKLSRMEKIYLIALLSSNMLITEAIKRKRYRKEIFELAGRLIDELMGDEKEKFLAALIDGVIYQK